MTASFPLDPLGPPPLLPPERPPAREQQAGVTTPEDKPKDNRRVTAAPQPPTSAENGAPGDPARQQAKTVKTTTIDWQTGAMVFRVIDEKSGQTVSQNPDEALLRLRAYARQKEAASNTEPPRETAPHRTEKTA